MNQQALEQEQQEQELDGIVRHEHKYRGAYETHVHSSDDTVFINIGAGVIQTTFFLDKAGARILMDQISLAIKGE